MGWLNVAGALFGGMKGAQGVGDYEAQKATAEQSSRNVQQGLTHLSPEAIQRKYQGLMDMMAPYMNQMASQQALAGQVAGRSAMGGLARMGLGSTGLGTALAGGIQSGAAMGSNMLRMQMQQDLMNQAINMRQFEAGLVAGQPVMQQPSLISNVTQRGGEALSSIGLWQQGQTDNAFRNRYMDWLEKSGG